jgi:photosynthetic reaction center cytochrome c subunit
MKFGSRGAIRGALATVVVCLLGMGGARGQVGPAEPKPQMSEEAFKNVQVLRGISVDQFLGTMGFFAASLSLNCTDCHTAESGGSWARYADDTPLKNTARRMVVMVNSINKADFGGERKVTCYTCHRGSQRPEVTPSLAEQYGTPPPEDPDKVEILNANGAAQPSAEQILDKYIQALGGAAQVGKLTSLVAKGTYTGFDTDFAKVPVDIYAQAPGRRTMVVHTLAGDNTTVYDGQQAWVAAVDKPVPLMPLTGGDLEGARADADLAFPARIKQEFQNWRSGFPAMTINDKAVQVIEGRTAGGSPIKLYFDKDSGLLVRQVRYNNTMIGLTPTHVEYSDYRVVGGVKVPFHWTVTWVDGQSTTELSSVQANVPIDATRFAKPAPAVPKPAAASR